MLTISIEINWKEGHEVQREQHKPKLLVMKYNVNNRMCVLRGDVESEAGMFAWMDAVDSTRGFRGENWL